jgi:hypothetical protein
LGFCLGLGAVSAAVIPEHPFAVEALLTDPDYGP